MDCEGMGLRIGGRLLNYLRFADDIIIIGKNIEEIIKMGIDL